MEQLKNYLSSLRGDIFKLLPMKEAAMNGLDNHIDEYLEGIVVNLSGATKTYPELSTQKLFLYVLNNMQYLLSNTVEFKVWRRIILSSTKNIDNLFIEYSGGSK